jgi:thiamine-monophosphate kinase
MGDELWLIGEVGMARAGFEALSRGVRGAAIRACIARWRRPEAQCTQGRRLVGRASAAIDVSDGLAGDAQHLAAASRVRVVFDAERVEAALSSELIVAAKRLGRVPLALALEGGEDYALLATGPRERRPRGAKIVGHIERGRGVFVLRGGKRSRLGASFDHFG